MLNEYLLLSIDKYVALFVNKTSREPNILLLDKKTHDDLCKHLSAIDRQEIKSLRSFTSCGRRMDVFVVICDSLVIKPCIG